MIRLIVVGVGLMMLLGGVEMPGAEGVLEIHAYPSRVTVLKNHTPVFQYRFSEVPYKPFADLLVTPAGQNVVRDAPEDHKHHHALMFAIKVDSLNFWEEYEAPGLERHRAFTDLGVRVTGGREDAAFTEGVDWVSPSTEAVLLEEERTVVWHALPDAVATLLSWECTFSLPEGKDEAELGGSHYHGLGMRFLESMDAGGTFLNAANAEGEVVRGSERLTPAAWCAYQSNADGQPVTVAMFGYPDNARSPTLWFTMDDPFAYLSATINLYREPYVLKAGDQMWLRYGVAVWDGTVAAREIQRVYEVWLGIAPERNGAIGAGCPGHEGAIGAGSPGHESASANGGAPK